MGTSTGTHDFLVHLPPGALDPEPAPWIRWGQGTPDGDASPFKEAQKGSIYIRVDAASGSPCFYQKVDESNNDADWSVSGIDPVALTTGLTEITHTAPGTADYAIQDLINTSAFGFVTKDEGNTVLSVIKNLQHRVDEIVMQLQSAGLLT